MAQTVLPSFRGYSDPLQLVDRIDTPYEERLATLQAWQEELARDDAPQEQRDLVLGAIHALEMGAEHQGDEPAEAPDDHGYGAEGSQET